MLDDDAPLIFDTRNNELSIKDQSLTIGNGNLLNLVTGFDEINKMEEFEVAFGSHAPHIGCQNHVLVKNDNLIVGNGNSVATKTLDAARGGPNHILVKDDNLIAGNRNTAARGSHAPYSDGHGQFKDDNFGKLMKGALEAARGSYAPYSGSPSGVALMDSEGKVYKGSYMESAAFNPSMMAVQAALVAYMVAGGGAYDRIVAAVLVEKEEPVIRQEDTVRLFIKHISPECEVRLVHCK